MIDHTKFHMKMRRNKQRIVNLGFLIHQLALAYDLMAVLLDQVCCKWVIWGSHCLVFLDQSVKRVGIGGSRSISSQDIFAKVVPVRVSTPVFVDPEISTQANGAQSSRVPVPLPEDPYEAIRQAYLDRSDTESEPFKDPVETETPKSPPTSLLESTPPTLIPILRRTARMAVRVPLAMSPGLSASMAAVEAMSKSAFCKRFRSSYKSSPSLSPPDLPSKKRYRGMCELVEDDDEEEDDDKEDEEIEESLDSDNVSKEAKDEGPTAKDEDPAAGDEGLAAGDEGRGMGVESHGLDDESCSLDDESHGLDDKGHSIESDRLGLGEEEEAVPKRQGSGSVPEPERPERVSASRQPTLTTWIDLEDGMVYIDVPAYPPPASPVQTPPLPEWSSGSLPISTAPSIVPLPVSSPMILLTGGLICDHTIRLEELLPALFERYDRDIRELFTRSGVIRDEIFSQRYQFRSLEHEQERVAVTFGAIWRPILVLESWAGQTDTQRASLWHAISDMQGENWELRLQLAEERRAQLELAEIVDSMRREQEPRGDV
ncbi:hypothetical protein Tco_0141067 [Tanacetum coccineum]